MHADLPFPDFAVACGEEASDPFVLHDGAVVRVGLFDASRTARPVAAAYASLAG